MPEPLDGYLHDLRSAAELYRTDGVSSRIAAVSATISYLRTLNVDPPLYTPLLDMLGQLEDEQRGRTGHTTATIDAATMGAVAAVITLAMRAGNKSQQAAKLVARQIGVSPRKRAELRRLLKFRKNLMDKRRPERALHVYFKVFQQANKSGGSRQEALQLGLQFLREKITATSKPNTPAK